MISITRPCHMTSKMASNPNIALLIVCTLFALQQPGVDAIFQAVVHKSIGRPWPLPQTIITTGKVHSLDAVNFQFRVVGSDCDIVRAAIDRYSQLIFSIHGVDATLRFQPMAMGRGNDGQILKQLDVNIKEECDGIYPSLEMNESYDLAIGVGVGVGVGTLKTKSVWGALRGLETFSQLVYLTDEGQYQINSTQIGDFPRFPHRGVLLDSSRHFLSVESILQNLDAMAYNKMNVFHWHIVDDPAFPYESTEFPELSVKGAYQPSAFHVYTQEDVKQVIEYSRLRGIRVVPEFDTPGHSLSWGKSQSDLLTRCYDKKGAFDGSFGPVNPISNATYAFLSRLMRELTTVFPDKYIHLGGDEVSFKCWQSNPEIREFMNTSGFGSHYEKLEELYMQKLLDIVSSYKSGYIVWQEVIDNKVKVRPDTVVEVWLSSQEAELAKVTKMGLRAILSSCWYLNYISYGSDWERFYKCDPQQFNGTAAQKQLVIGGELCMWGEYVDSTNVISRTWPRGSAVAERLWSGQYVRNIADATVRLEEQRCRMLSRGLPVEPVSGPGSCRREYTRG